MNNDDAPDRRSGAEGPPARPADDAAKAAPPADADPSDPAAAAAEPVPPPETAEQKVARLEKEKAEQHERLLRIAAEFENYKRRHKRDLDDAMIRAREQILKEVLPVLDNLDRALQATTRGGTVEALAQGVRLVERQLLSGLEKFEVKAFDAKGQPFDPSRHDAVQQIETTDFPPGTVAVEFARGYTIGDRLLRAALVAVAKAPLSPPPPDSGANGQDGAAAPDGG